ncbi:MAG: DNA-binding protein [Desulfurococcales archaeon]|nr:DNA-binding protein [Desulfurococcales archaeon]
MSLDYEEDEELELLRRRKLLELQRKLEEERRRKELEEAEARRDAILRSILTAEARNRLANIKLVRPELARMAEDYVLQLVQAGRLSPPVDDATVKEILLELDSRSRRSFEIKFKRK